MPEICVPERLLRLYGRSFARENADGYTAVVRDYYTEKPFFCVTGTMMSSEMIMGDSVRLFDQWTSRG